MKKTLSYFRRLPYTRRSQLFVENGQRYWHAWVEELPGCEVDGETKASAHHALAEVFDDYIRAKLEWGSVIAEPTRWPGLQKRTRAKTTRASVKLVRGPDASLDQMTNEDREEATERTAETLVGT